MKTKRTPALNRAGAAGVLAICLGLLFSARVSAAVIDTYPDWDGNVTQSYLKVAQSFLAPADNMLTSWQFTVAPIALQTNILFQIVAWDPASGPTGSPLFSRILSWPASGGDILVDSINLTLTPAASYAAVLDLNGYSGRSVDFEYNQNSYDLGSASWYGGINPSWEYLGSPYNTEFRAEFHAVPEPANLVGLGVAGGVVARHLRRRSLFGLKTIRDDRQPRGIAGTLSNNLVLGPSWAAKLEPRPGPLIPPRG